MRWSKPKILEIAVGAEINSYACAGIVWPSETQRRWRTETRHAATVAWLVWSN